MCPSGQSASGSGNGECKGSRLSVWLEGDERGRRQRRSKWERGRQAVQGGGSPSSQWITAAVHSLSVMIVLWLCWEKKSPLFELHTEIFMDRMR